MPKIKPSSKPKPSLSPRKKSTRSKDALHQKFLNSLIHIEKHWDKKVSQLKKQQAALNQALVKAKQKQKAAPKQGKKTTPAMLKLQTALGALLLEVAQAKDTSNKYAALHKIIKQFERDWSKKEQSTPKSVAPKPVKAKKASPQRAPEARTKPKKSTKKMMKDPVHLFEDNTLFFEPSENHLEVEEILLEDEEN